MPLKICELKAELRRAGFLGRLWRSRHTGWMHSLIPAQLTMPGQDAIESWIDAARACGRRVATPHMFGAGQ